MGKPKKNKELYALCDQIWDVRASLRGLGALFMQEVRDTCFETNDLHGVGLLIKSLGNNLETIEDELRQNISQK